MSAHTSLKSAPSVTPHAADSAAKLADAVRTAREVASKDRGDVTADSRAAFEDYLARRIRR